MSPINWYGRNDHTWTTVSYDTYAIEFGWQHLKICNWICQGIIYNNSVNNDNDDNENDSDSNDNNENNSDNQNDNNDA